MLRDYLATTTHNEYDAKIRAKGLMISLVLSILNNTKNDEHKLIVDNFIGSLLLRSTPCISRISYNWREKLDIVNHTTNKEKIFSS